MRLPVVVLLGGARRIVTMDVSKDELDPFKPSYIFARCPKCGAEAKLWRKVKFPKRKRVRTYECETCHYEAEVIVRK